MLRDRVEDFMQCGSGKDRGGSTAEVDASDLLPGKPIFFHQQLCTDGVYHFVHVFHGSGKVEVAIGASFFAEGDMDVDSGHCAKVVAITASLVIRRSVLAYLLRHVSTFSSLLNISRKSVQVKIRYRPLVQLLMINEHICVLCSSKSSVCDLQYGCGGCFVILGIVIKG